jgi:hypothetical protein
VAEPIADIHSGDEGNTGCLIGGSASQKTMPKLIAEGADIRRQSRTISNALSRLRQGYGEPGDNAFHLALGAFVREYFRNSKNEIIHSRFTDRI